MFPSAWRLRGFRLTDTSSAKMPCICLCNFFFFSSYNRPHHDIHTVLYWNYHNSQPMRSHYMNTWYNNSQVSFMASTGFSVRCLLWYFLTSLNLRLGWCLMYAKILANLSLVMLIDVMLIKKKRVFC